MAKSLRSKRKQEHKTLKRQSIFGADAAEREKRIAERLHKAAIDDILAKQEGSAPKKEEAMEVETEVPSTTVTTAPTADPEGSSGSSASKKKSTGGWSRRKPRGRKSKKSRK